MSNEASGNEGQQSSWPPSDVHHPNPFVQGMPPALARHLAIFDDLDFRVYTHQEWKDLHMSHGENIVVYYPDGHTTTGIPEHVKELDVMWTWAPDNRITEHSVRFGTNDGEWTAVMGYLDGTFTKPMAMPDGKSIQPTGKTYHLPMATLGHWTADGVMDREYLFWDTGALMQMVGAAS